MHELSIIKKIIENAESVAKKEGIKKVSLIRMRIGKMAGFEPEQLNFLFETYEKDACLNDTRLEIKEIPVELECPECRYVFTDGRFDDHDFAHTISHAPLAYAPPSCPKCGADGSIIIHGRELELIDMEGE